MKKKKPGNWRTLEDENFEKEERKKATTNKWDKLINEVEEEEAKSEDVNALFKKIYNDADEDTRRAMMKSYTESKGTVLSTNWKEIGSKKTEIKPPDSMELKM